MSRRRRHRTSRQRSQDSSQTCAGAASSGREALVPGSSPGQALRDADLRSAPQDEGAAVLIRFAQSDDDIVAIHRFMIAHAAAEMAEAEVDALIYWRTIQDTVREGAGLIAMIDGKIAGYLGLWKSRYDYSKAFFLHDRGFYVLPAHRGGAVGAALLQEARAIAQEGDLTLKIIDTNPSKRRRAVTGQILGFRPAGRVFTEIPSRPHR
jgi:GNAT superfamily N-acetyltransferase